MLAVATSGLSSTSRTVPVCRFADHRLAVIGRDRWSLAGARQVDRDVVPLPSSLSIFTVPPAWCAKPCTCERPKPGALADRLGGEERLEHLGQNVGGMPMPVSSTQMAMYSPGATTSSSSTTTLRAVIVTVPPSGMASRALMTRLTSAISNSLTSTVTGQSVGVDVDQQPDIAAQARTSGLRGSNRAAGATSIASGLTRWRREKVSNCRVSVAPRWAASSIACAARVAFGSSVGELLQRLDMAGDDHQQIVEVVRDAAGELAERLHLLRLGELLLHPLERDLRVAPLGDVAGDLGEADQLAVVVADRIDDDAGPEERAVLADAPAFLLEAPVSRGDLQAPARACRRRGRSSV